jgi:hypothetical protein
VSDADWVDSEIEAIKKMDSFILVNDEIPRKLNLADDNFVISYGVCDIPPRNVSRFEDGKIHVVYAGTIENRKLGAFTAIESARYLSNQFVMHILGFGNEENVALAKARINEINNVTGGVRVQYNDALSGEALDQFLHRCHIGLSSNVMRPNFANNTFPSKVITYMCHDLSVVLGYAKAFYDIPISQNWKFFMDYDAKVIAQAIMEAEIIPIGYYNSILNELNQKLTEFLRKVVK